MSDIAIECIQKELDNAYEMAIREAGFAIASLKELRTALKQASKGNHIEGPPICYTQHTDIMRLYQHRIYTLERLLEEIAFERKMEDDDSGVTTPLKLWKKEHHPS